MYSDVPDGQRNKDPEAAIPTDEGLEATDASPAKLLIPSGRSLVGRSSSCKIVLAHRTVSRVHAAVAVSAQAMEVRDLGSRNGTFVNGTPVQEAKLNAGDRVRFGGAEFQVEVDPPAFVGVDREEQSTLRLKRLPEPPAGGRFPTDWQRVVELMAEGRTELEIGNALGWSHEEVSRNLAEICTHFGVETPSGLIALLGIRPPSAPGS